jgi:DNA-binding SARP family transcriptional activator
MRRMVVENLGETLAAGGETRIHLCGRLTARLCGVRLEDDLPGRQGRTLFAFLAAHRLRATPRRELLEVLWPDVAPAAAEAALAALLAKLRRVLGAGALAGRQELRLVLPGDAWIDLEAAGDGLHSAESALAARDWPRAWGPARVALHIAERGFLPGYEAPWINVVRQRLHDLLVRAHEAVATCSLEIGGAEIATAERSARRLTLLAPYRESGYRLLMQTLAARDNIGESLMVYERLCGVMREELGVSPSPATQSLHRQLLRGSAAG